MPVSLLSQPFSITFRLLHDIGVMSAMDLTFQLHALFPVQRPTFFGLAEHVMLTLVSSIAAEQDGMASLSPEEHMHVSVPIDLPLCCHLGSNLDQPSCRRPLHVSLSGVITASGPLRVQTANDIWLLTSNASWSVSEGLRGPWVSKRS